MFSAAYIPVQEVIKIMCLRENDTSLSMAAIYQSYLPSVYNDFRFSAVKQTVTKKYYLDLANNTLLLPNDCLLVTGVGCYDDCGNIKPLWYNKKVPVSLLFENALPCSCETCGEDHGYCSMIKSFDSVEEVVTINGSDYTNVTNTNILQDGTIIRVKKEYILSEMNRDMEGGGVQAIQKTEELCKLDLLPCGCVEQSASNTTKIDTLCSSCCSFGTGCGTYNADCCETINGYSFNIDVQGRMLVMSPNYNRDYVILKYVTALNETGDYKIPTIALEAMIRGIKYYRSLDDSKQPSFMRGQNSITHRAYTAELNKVRKRISPLNWDKVMDALGVMSTKNQC